MNIRDIREGGVKDEIIGTIIELGEPKSTKAGRVAEGILRDDSGQVKLQIWDHDIDRVKQGDRVSIVKGYASVFRGELQFGTGKYGHLAVVEGDNNVPVKSEPPKPVQEQKPSAGWSTLGHYYNNVKELREADAKDANTLLKQGWTLEAVKERHVTEPSPEGLRHDSAIIYVLSRRFD